jgi:hypothetical protein
MARAANAFCEGGQPLKRLKNGNGSYWKKLAWLAPPTRSLASNFQGDDQRGLLSRTGFTADAAGAGSSAIFADANASKGVVVGLNAHYRSHETSLEA